MKMYRKEIDGKMFIDEGKYLKTDNGEFIKNPTKEQMEKHGWEEFEFEIPQQPKAVDPKEIFKNINPINIPEPVINL